MICLTLLSPIYFNICNRICANFRTLPMDRIRLFYTGPACPHFITFPSFSAFAYISFLPSCLPIILSALNIYITPPHLLHLLPHIRLVRVVATLLSQCDVPLACYTVLYLGL
ncbi:hypothetical protein C8Q72DRAFT_847577 [Fomitopsis betulina]|nr:hypothetical protein C8Q72DRAFT_847577 [Fomitopsis betulina]